MLTISSVSYIDLDGVSQTLATSEYDVDTSSEPGRITRSYNTTWPSLREITGNVTITHTAGYGATHDTVPEPIKLAIIMLASQWYKVREPVLVGMASKEIELGFEALLSEYKEVLV